MSKPVFYAEVTDLFCGEMNYSYLSRYCIRANTMRGAIGKLSRYYGLSFRIQDSEGDWSATYHSTSHLTGVIIDKMESRELPEHTTMVIL